MEYDLDHLAKQTTVLLDRLERLSADSKWAHRASGFRGSLIRELKELESGHPDPAGMGSMITQANKILILAAREIQSPDSF